MSDQIFWLARLDESRPRATITPDYVRGVGAQAEFAEVRFALEPDAVRSLKSLDPSRGVSDVALCAAMLAITLAKHQRDDDFVAGQLVTGNDAPIVVPVALNCSGESAFNEILQGVDVELSAVGRRSAQFLSMAPQVLGSKAATLRPPLLELAFGLEAGDSRIDPRPLGFDLNVIFEVNAGQVGGRIVYARDRYRAERMQALARHLERAAVAAAHSPKTPVKEFEIIGEDELRTVVHRFNQHSSSYPLGTTLHGLFEQQAHRTADAVAAIHNGESISYEQLDQRANQLAGQLLVSGLSRGQFVGVLLHRGIDFLVSILGVMKAGGAYVPLDPTYPEERIRHMLADSEAAVVIANSDLVLQYSDAIAAVASIRSVISMSGDVRLPASLEGKVSLVTSRELVARATGNPGVPVGGRDRAYMIYTSGTTGLPKGAICRHDGAINHLFGELEGVGIRGAFRFLQTAASSSDISVWQFLAPLACGGATVIVDYETVVDPVLLFDVLQRQSIDLAEPVPVVLRGLLDHIESLPPSGRALPALRCMMATGEALPVELANRWLRLYPGVPIANTYGPTETSDDVTQLVASQSLDPRLGPVVPIGAPLPNVRIFVLDRYLRAVPVGTPGEICVAGVAVGEGYWKQPAKTEAAFVPCPYPEVVSGPMYRTGDLGRWLPDGSIEFLGRIDQQVKIRGFRVEPGEIEAAMTAHPAIQDAAVVAANGGSGLRLVGYYVLHEGQQFTAADLRGYLASTLAEHMVPSTLIPLRALPTTPLGKIDRRALAKADFRPAAEGRPRVEPRTPTERLLAEIWSQVLGGAEVSSQDNFFEVGGDSILTIHVVSALRRKGIVIAPRQIFICPVLADLAQWIDEKSAASDVGKPFAVKLRRTQEFEKAHWQGVLGDAFSSLEDVYPLSATQRGIYYQSLLMRRNSGAYVEQFAFDIDGELDPKLFEEAWNHVTRQTAALRTAIIRRKSPQPVQVVLGDCWFAMHEVDLRLMPPSERDARFEALQVEDRMRGYDLARPPLTRGLLARFGERQWRFLWSYHHLILDGWSEPLVIDDVLRTYGALAAGRSPPVLEQTPYKTFVEWSEAQPLDAAESYWRGQLAGFVAPVSIVDTSPGITPPSSAELLHSWHDADVTTDDFARLSDACHRQRITLSALMHGAWALVLRDRSGADDVLFGSVASGRQCEISGIESVRGLVVATQPLRVRLAHDATYASWLRLLQLQMAEMREYEHTPLASIQQWSEVPAEKRPLFDSLVDIGNYHNVDLSDSQLGQFKISRVRYSTQPLYGLTLFVVVGADPLVRIVYDKRRYAPDTVRALVAELMDHLRAFVENPEQRLGGVRKSSSG